VNRRIELSGTMSKAKAGLTCANLSDGTKARVKLLDVEETRDPLRAAVPSAGEG